MMFTADVSVEDHKGIIAKVFTTEMEKRDRSTLAMKKSKNKVTFKVSAKDYTAFKATMLTLIKLLEVHHTVEAIYESNHRTD